MQTESPITRKRGQLQFSVPQASAEPSCSSQSQSRCLIGSFQDPPPSHQTTSSRITQNWRVLGRSSYPTINRTCNWKCSFFDIPLQLCEDPATSSYSNLGSDVNRGGDKVCKQRQWPKHMQVIASSLLQASKRITHQEGQTSLTAGFDHTKTVEMPSHAD